MDQTARALERETRKWLERLKKEVPNTKELLKKAKVKDSAVNDAIKDAVKDSLKNMQAYVDDCQHFLEKKDLIRAFEAVVYAWGIWETLKHLKLIE